MIGLGSDENEIFTLDLIVLDLWLRSRVLKLWQKKKSCAMCVSFLHCSHLLKTPSVPLFRPHYTSTKHHHQYHHHHHHHQQQQYYYLHQYHLLKSQYVCRLKSFNLYFVYTPIVHISYMIYHISLSGNKLESSNLNRNSKT